MTTYSRPEDRMAFPTHQYGPLADTLAPGNPILSAWQSQGQRKGGLPSDNGAYACVDGTQRAGSHPQQDLKTRPHMQGFEPSTVAPTNLWSDTPGNSVQPSSQDILPSMISNLPEPLGASNLNSMPLSNGILSAIPRGSTSFDTSSAAHPIKRESTSTDPNGSPAEPEPAAPPKKSRRASGKRTSSRSKLDRHDSHQDQDDEKDEQPSKPASRTQRYREKNKVAASKCRARKRQQLQNIESRCTHYSAVNSELRLQVQDLTGELNNLRAMALGHQSCGCRVAWYNASQAHQFARNAQESCSHGGGGQLSPAK